MRSILTWCFPHCVCVPVKLCACARRIVSIHVTGPEGKGQGIHYPRSQSRHDYHSGRKLSIVRKADGPRIKKRCRDELINRRTTVCRSSSASCEEAEITADFGLTAMRLRPLREDWLREERQAAVRKTDSSQLEVVGRGVR